MYRSRCHGRTFRNSATSSTPIPDRARARGSATTKHEGVALQNAGCRVHGAKRSKAFSAQHVGGRGSISSITSVPSSNFACDQGWVRDAALRQAPAKACSAAVSPQNRCSTRASSSTIRSPAAKPARRRTCPAALRFGVLSARERKSHGEGNTPDSTTADPRKPMARLHDSTNAGS